MDLPGLQTCWIEPAPDRAGDPIFGVRIERWREPDFWQGALHPEDRRAILAACRAGAAAGVPFLVDYRLIGPGGSTRRIRERLIRRETGSGPRLRGEMDELPVCGVAPGPALPAVPEPRPCDPAEIARTVLAGIEALAAEAEQGPGGRLAGVLAPGAAPRIALSVLPEVPERLLADPDYLRRILELIFADGLASGARGELAMRLLAEPGALVLRMTLASPAPRRPHDPGRARRIAELLALVETLGGSVGFDCAAGGPHRSTVRLPRIEAQEPAARGTAGSGQLRLLYAEDDVTSAQVMAALLGLQGLAAEIAINGEDAVAMYRAGRFDMVLVDPNMPLLDGLAATRRIREIEAMEARPRVPIAAVSASDDAETRRACRAAGMDAYLAKPVRLDQLRALIERFAPRRGGPHG
ncbi:hypothetical protein LNKW23_16910 [Paralimibaculum aggregatum]|uniref:Response regulatory domain-containing protein n=1 Tax=Paralimibaculum aggregatum TaxID=3036245 RepID=A0ABQ6LNW2_9RHOB|nr:response regulator [Limibaculum sp. NKW23]GMG82478.1 hypothetical protein LNKW23_16910 [Limibaculum sp. NKW23]